MSQVVSPEGPLDATVRLNGAPPPGPPKPSHRRALVAGISIALVAIVVAAIVFLTGGQSSHTAKILPSAVYQQKLSSALGPLVTENQALSNALESIDGSQPSINKAQAATTQAQAAVASGRGAVGVLTVPASQATLQQQTEQALTQENGYLQAVSATLENPIGQSSSQLQTLATNTQTALIPLNQIVPGASTSISDPTNLLNWVAGANAAAKRQSASKPPSTTNGGQQASPTPSTPSMRYCDQNIQASSTASCPFAENIFSSLQAQWSSGNPGPYSLTVYSPVTGESYNVQCQSNAASNMICTNQSDTSSVVTFPVSTL